MELPGLICSRSGEVIKRKVAVPEKPKPVRDDG
jgi:hypothetical protein